MSGLNYERIVGYNKQYIVLATTICPVCNAGPGKKCFPDYKTNTLGSSPVMHIERANIYLSRCGLRPFNPNSVKFCWMPLNAPYIGEVQHGSTIDKRLRLYSQLAAKGDKKMIQSSLKEKAILVDFDGGYYEWHRRDKSIEKDVGTRAGVSQGVGRYRKNIFHGNDHLLHSLRQVVQHARSESESMTLPWHPSRRLLLNINFLRHQKKMAECRNALDLLFSRLEEEWDSMIEGAKDSLGPLYNPDNYPSFSDVKRATYIKATFYPMADASDVRLQADEDMVNAIRQEVTRNERKLFSDAVYGVWERLFNILDNAKDNLSKRTGGNTRFRTEWFGHLASLAPVLKGLNLGEDDRLDEMAERLTRICTGRDEDQIKQKWDIRDRVRTDVDALYQDVAAIFGPMRKAKEGE